jgi:hypothetical protein
MIFQKTARLAASPLRLLALGAWALTAPLTLSGCPSDPVPTDTGGGGMDSPAAPDAASTASCLGDIDSDERLEIPGLDGEIEVVYDDRGMPHIYGTTVHDLVVVQAYLMARDRYGQMDFIRRNVLGRLSEVAGALSPDLPDTDFDNRVNGYARMGRTIYEALPATSRSRVAADAFAEGVNAYIAAVDAGLESPQIEGGDLVALLTTPAVDREWRGSDIFAMARFQAASLSYDAGSDISRTELLADAREAFPAGDPRASIHQDLFSELPARPVYTRDCDSPPCFNDGSSMALRRPERVRPGQVIFALSNPDPEISPDVALAAGAAFAGDGRSINNALAYPGIFKGALSVRASAITAPMLLAAAEAIAALAPKGDVVPSPFDPRVHAAVRDAVAAKATAQGIAGTATL